MASPLLSEVPIHWWIELGLVTFIIYILFCKREYNPLKWGQGARPPKELTEEEIDEMVDEWTPEPLVPVVPAGPASPMDSVTIAEYSPDGKHVTLEGGGAPVLNAASHNFLGLASSGEVKAAGKEVLLTHSLGSCGPRGFYGTTVKHLELEAALARFFSAPEAICYSDGSSTVSSAIPAFCKRGDLLVVDSGCNHIVRTGVNLSRSTVLFFKHNDMADLQRVLQGVVDKDKVDDRSRTQRRFIVAEGLYGNSGHIAPLPRIIELKKQYKFRLVLDESLSFGVLGGTGRGLTEYFGVSPSDIEVLLGSMETSLASVGGFCVGAREVVDHQRLSGAGYCFSASAPPFTCAMAQTALTIMSTHTDTLTALRTVAANVHAALSAVPGVDVLSSPESPVCHFVPETFKSVLAGNRKGQLTAVKAIAAAMLERGVLVDVKRDTAKESVVLLPTVRVCVSSLFSPADIALIAAAARDAILA